MPAMRAPSLRATASVSRMLWHNKPALPLCSAEHQGRARLQCAPRPHSISSFPRPLSSTAASWIKKLKSALADPIARTELNWVSFAEENLDHNWETACDGEVGGGSTVSLTTSPSGTALFQGSLCLGMTDVSREREEERKRSAIRKAFNPKTVQSARQGFAGFASKPGHLEADIDEFNTMVLRVKTDGRLYFVNIRTSNCGIGDTYQAPLQCPPDQWYKVTIPASVFRLTCRGKVHIEEVRMSWRDVTTFGISILDREEGPFKLELDYVQLLRDPKQPDDEL